MTASPSLHERQILALTDTLAEFLPEMADYDRAELAELVVRKGLAEDALRAAHALGGRRALLTLIYRSEP